MADKLPDSINDQIEREKYNKLRMIQINTYYSKRYQAHIGVIKRVLLYLVALILVVVLAKKNVIVFIPDIIYRFLGFLIIIVGFYDITRKIFDLSLRDNMDYDKYEWSWNKYKTRDVSKNNINNDNLDNDVSDECKKKNRIRKQALKNLNILEGETCSDDTCCGEGTMFDKDTNKCVVVSNFQNISDNDISPWTGKGQFDSYENVINYSSFNIL